MATTSSVNLSLTIVLSVNQVAIAQQNPHGQLPVTSVVQPYLWLIRDPIVHNDLGLTTGQRRAAKRHPLWPSPPFSRPAPRPGLLLIGRSPIALSSPKRCPARPSPDRPLSRACPRLQGAEPQHPRLSARRQRPAWSPLRPRFRSWSQAVQLPALCPLPWPCAMPWDLCGTAPSWVGTVFSP